MSLDPSKFKVAQMPKTRSSMSPWLRHVVNRLQREVGELVEQAKQVRQAKPKPKPTEAGEREFLSVREVAEILPVSEKSIRWWIFNDVQRFASLCVSRRGRRVFIGRKALDKWIEGGGPAAALGGKRRS